MGNQEILYQVSEVIEDRRLNPKEGSYTNYLMEKGIDTFVEIGPGKTLSGFVKKIDRSYTTYSISDVESFEAFLADMEG